VSALKGALNGVRVLDASRVLAGPFAGQILSDLGAEVLKVEEPSQGDETRGWGPPFAPDGASAYFLSCNRGKRGIALDLKTPAGRGVLVELAKKADIVLENFRTASAAKLGLTPKDLLAANPQLIVASISGYGKSGKFADDAGYDFVVQGLSGLMAMTGPREGIPHKAGVAMADVVTGLYTATAALAALHARKTSGHGYAIDIALLDCAVASMVNVAQAYLTTGQAPRRQGNAHLQIVPYELFAAKDGWLVLAVGNDAQWRRFCDVAGRADLAADPRYAKNQGRVAARDALVPEIGRTIATRGVAAWVHDLKAAQVPAGPVWDFTELFASPLARERRLKISVKKADGTPVELVRSPLVDDLAAALAPPKLGEHTAAALKDWLGYDAAKVATLKKDGAW